MARRYRHHRKIQRNAQANSAELVLDSNTATLPSTNTTTSELANDLRKTVIIVIALVLFLLVIGYLNTQFNWTQAFGNLLYKVLNIR